MVYVESPHPCSGKHLPWVMQSTADHRLKLLPITMTTDRDQLQSSSKHFRSKLFHILPEKKMKRLLHHKYVKRMV